MFATVIFFYFITIILSIVGDLFFIVVGVEVT